MVTSDYLSTGGDGYSMLKEQEGSTKGEDALSLLESYFKLRSPVSPPVEGRTVDLARLNMIKKGDCTSGSNVVTINGFLQIILSAFIITHLL